jgi:hypothetical protein
MPAQRPQGTIIPSLFIGLGGTGSVIVNRIAARASHVPNWESQLKDLTAFFVIDTNHLDQNKLTHDVPRGSRQLIGAIDKRAVVEAYRRAGDRRVLQWLDERYVPRPGAKPGAGQIRVESRLSYHVASAETRHLLEAQIRRLLEPHNTWRSAHSNKLNVYLYCTLAGGTGSGSFLPMAYLVQDLARSFHWEARVIGNFMLSTTMTQAVKPELHTDIHANCYAALKELEHLTKLEYPRVQERLPNGLEFVYWNDQNRPEPTRVRTGPFFLSFVIDQPRHLSIEKMEESVADASFLQLFTPLIDSIAGELDNYEKKLIELARLSGAYQDVGMGYAKHFGSFGSSALVLPAEELLHYCALRFAAGALRRQLTFNFDPSSRQDLARLLARFAVDTSSDAFRRLDESARFDRVNGAFVDSVREIARKDREEKQPEGYWNRIVEASEYGVLTGQVNDQGEPIRRESWLQQIDRLLTEAREGALKEVSIQEDALIFHRETYQQWTDIVARLLERARLSARRVDTEKKLFESAGRDGDAITALGLDPLQERYLVLLLLEQVRGKWLPEAVARATALKAESVFSPETEHKLRDVDYGRLKTAAEARTTFGRPDEQRFKLAQDQVHSDYRNAIRATLGFFDADVRQAQFRALVEFLEERAKLYARLSLRLNRLVDHIEAEAESVRNTQQAGPTPRLSLSVEVFETLTEPRRRLWAEVFDELFIADGAEYTTFDRQQLAKVIAEQLAPAPTASGRFEIKSDDRIANDLETTLVALGTEKFRESLYGGRGAPLHVERGLELEARLVHGPTADRATIARYIDSKFMALDQMSGVLARVNLTKGGAENDGVVPYRARLVLYQPGLYTEGFISRLKSHVALAGLAPNEAAKNAETFLDPHLVVVHDIIASIPLSYFDPIVGEIQNAFDIVASQQQRGYNLHIEAAWEHTLPNLDPRRGELRVDWAVRLLLDALLAGVVKPSKDGVFTWWRESGAPEPLGRTLGASLYSLGVLYQNEYLRGSFQEATARTLSSLGPGEREERAAELRTFLKNQLEEIALRKMDQRASTAALVDEPVYTVLLKLVSASDTSGSQAIGAASFPSF